MWFYVDMIGTDVNNCVVFPLDKWYIVIRVTIENCGNVTCKQFINGDTEDKE